MHSVYNNIWTNYNINDTNNTVDVFNINKLPVKLSMVNTLAPFISNELKEKYEQALLNCGYVMGGFKRILVYFSPLNKFIEYDNDFAVDKSSYISIIF